MLLYHSCVLCRRTCLFRSCHALVFSHVCTIGPWSNWTPARGGSWVGLEPLGPLCGADSSGLLSCHFEPFCLAVILASALVSHSANMPPENKRQRGPGRRGGGGPSQEATTTRLLSAHDRALERLKAGLTVMLFVPRLLSDAIEKATGRVPCFGHCKVNSAAHHGGTAGSRQCLPAFLHG